MKATHGNVEYRQPPARKSMHARIVHDLGMRILGGELEPGAAALAAAAASDEQLAGIAQAYEGMAAAPDADAMLEPDLAFHRRIAEATNNDLLAYIGNMLSLALRESIKLSSKHPNTHALSLPRHKAILTALLHRDPLAAHQATLVQLKETREDITEILESGLDLR